MRKSCGPIPPNVRLKMSLAHKGKVFTEEHRKNLSIASTGFKHSEATKKMMSEQRKGKASPRKGCKLSQEQIAKMVSFHKGKTLSKETREKIRQTHIARGIGERVAILTRGKPAWNKGLKGAYVPSEEVRKKISEGLKRVGHRPPHISGDKHYKWNGGITPDNFKIRNSIQMKVWRQAVFSRDCWTCQKCESKGVELAAHHIESFHSHPELRFAIDNGIALCKGCHMNFHNRFGRKFNNRAQLDQFLFIAPASETETKEFLASQKPAPKPK